MKKQRRIQAAILLMTVSGMVLFTGCREKDSRDTELQQEVTVQTDEKSAEVIVDGKDNLQVKGKMDGAMYISESGNIEITLPNEGWECDSDVQDGISFSSADGTITILKMDGPEAVKSSMFKTQEEYLAYLNGTSPSLEGEVVSFEHLEEGGQEKFRAVFHYTGANDYHYIVSEGRSFTDYCYFISGMLMSEDENVLNGVRTSIAECQITK